MGMNEDFLSLPQPEQRKVLNSMNKDFAGLPPAEQDNVLANLDKVNIPALLNKPEPNPVDDMLVGAPPKPEPGILEKRGANIREHLTPKDPNEAIYESARLGPKRALWVAGEGAGVVNDAVGKVLSGVWSITPDFIKKSLMPGGHSGADKDIMGVIAPAIQKGGQFADWFKGNYPEEYKSVAALLNISTGAPLTRGAVLGGKRVAGNIAEKTSIAMGKQSADAAEKSLTKVVNDTMYKMRPSKKRFASQFGDFEANSKEAVREIVGNKGNIKYKNLDGTERAGGVPESLYDYVQAIDQTKKGIYEAYTAQAKQAGEGGVRISNKKILDYLNKELNNPRIQRQPGTVSYIEKQIEIYGKLDNQPPQVIQGFIEDINNQRAQYMKTGIPENYSQNTIDRGIADIYRAEMDNAIMNYGGEGYQALRNKYKALRSIEDDVAQRTKVHLQRANKGLLDYADIFITPQILYGVATGNLILAGKGVAEKGIQMWIKGMVNPDKNIKKMFRKADQILTKQSAKSAKAVEPEVVDFDAVGRPYGPQGFVQKDPARLLPGGQGFGLSNELRAEAVKGGRALPQGDLKLLPYQGNFILLDPQTGARKVLTPAELNALKEKMGLPSERTALPPGEGRKQLPRFTGSPKSLEDIKGELPRMYQGSRENVPLEQLDPELAAMVRAFLMRNQ